MNSIKRLNKIRKKQIRETKKKYKILQKQERREELNQKKEQKLREKKERKIIKLEEKINPLRKLKRLNFSKKEKIEYLEKEKERISQEYDTIIKKIFESRQKNYFLETSKRNITNQKRIDKIENQINSNLEKRYKYEKENTAKEGIILEIENKLSELKNTSYKSL